MKLHPTERGFLYGKFTDRFGSKCSLQESSLATEAAVWLGVDTAFDGKECTRMHLTQDMVRDLLPALQHFAKTGELPPA